MPNTPKLSEDVENRVRELYLKDYVADETESREMILIGMKDPWYEWWINIISQELSTLKAQVRKEIEELIEKYQKSEEVTVNGQRFLIVGGLKKKFGYPFPDTKEKYLIREIKQAISILKEE